MYDNDTLGDCTCAAVAHMLISWDAQEKAKKTAPSVMDVVHLYEAVSGGQDQGAACLDVLNRWRRVGLEGDRIAGYAEVSPQSMVQMKLAMWQFGGAYLGLAMPSNAQDQIGDLWTVTSPNLSGDAEPGTWGGHCVDLVGYDADGLTCITWGQTQRMTWDWLTSYCEEAYAVLDTVDWLGDIPGLKGAALTKALRKI
jgi:hypothetical protein